MKIRCTGPKKFIPGLAVGILLCWAVAGHASEQWDARASARVNLRTNPSLNGVILGIVPKGHKVRIMEKQGLWSKVDVEGDIHGKGWMYAEYLEAILPKAPATESSSQTTGAVIPSGEPKQGLHPGEPPPKTRTDGKAVKLLRTALPANASIVRKNAQSSARNEQRETMIDTGAQAKAEIYESGESGHMVASQALSESQTKVEETKPLNNLSFCNVSNTGSEQQVLARNELRDAENESIALSQEGPPIAREPAHISPAQPALADLRRNALGFSEKSSLGAVEPSNPAPFQKIVPGDEAKKNDPVHETPSPARTKALSDTRAEVASVAKKAVPFERKRLINKQVTIGPVEIALKLLAIALSCIIILFLYRANKIATNHYEALMQFHSLDSRQRR
jgi:uncharacterized protein YraI